MATIHNTQLVWMLRVTLREAGAAVDRTRLAPIIPAPPFRNEFVNRLVSLVILVAFVAQHFMCCCTETAAHSCGDDHPANAGQACVYTYEHTHPHGDHDHEHRDHDHGLFHRDHDAHCDAKETDHGSCPCDRPHQHHVCIGTHVFFVAAPRDEMPIENLSHCFPVANTDVLNPLAMTVRTSFGHHGVDYGPPLSTCPQRSALCVYRI